MILTNPKAALEAAQKRLEEAEKAYYTLGKGVEKICYYVLPSYWHNVSAEVEKVHPENYVLYKVILTKYEAKQKEEITLFVSKEGEALSIYEPLNLWKEMVQKGYTLVSFKEWRKTHSIGETLERVSVFLDGRSWHIATYKPFEE